VGDAALHAPARDGSPSRNGTQQRARFGKDGSYEIDVPFTSTKELLMDILKFGPDVEVVSPASLRAEVAARAEETAKKYR
jgi:predicted DNA-binding transcriptional regulator YafY